MNLIKQKKDVWAVFDESTNQILVENMTIDEVVLWMMNKEKERLVEHIKQYEPPMSWDEAQFLAGRFSCCECSKTLDVYEPKWPLERQRCKACRSQY
jgi:hypothetical protein